MCAGVLVPAAWLVKCHNPGTRKLAHITFASFLRQFRKHPLVPEFENTNNGVKIQF